MCRGSPFHSTLNANIITSLGMCKVCTEAVHSVALQRRTFLQVWACVKYVSRRSIPQHFEHERYHRFGHVSTTDVLTQKIGGDQNLSKIFFVLLFFGPAMDLPAQKLSLLLPPEDMALSGASGFNVDILVCKRLWRLTLRPNTRQRGCSFTRYSDLFASPLSLSLSLNATHWP